MDMIVNKIAASGLITLNLEDYLPDENQLVSFDLKPFLFREMILREKDFRAALPIHDWSQYEGKNVAVHCTVDAIIPMWAYMLVASMLQEKAVSIYYGNREEMIAHFHLKNIEAIDTAIFQNQRVVIKGCGARPLSAAAFIAITEKLQPVVKAIMYGEPCSTVPVFKLKKQE